MKGVELAPNESEVVAFLRTIRRRTCIGAGVTSCSVGGEDRTHGLGFRRASLYPLSYTDMLLTLYYIESIYPPHVANSYMSSLSAWALTTLAHLSNFY